MKTALVCQQQSCQNPVFESRDFIFWHLTRQLYYKGENDDHSQSSLPVLVPLLLECKEKKKPTVACCFICYLEKSFIERSLLWVCKNKSVRPRYTSRGWNRRLQSASRSSQCFGENAEFSLCQHFVHTSLSKVSPGLVADPNWIPSSYWPFHSDQYIKFSPQNTILILIIGVIITVCV